LLSEEYSSVLFDVGINTIYPLSTIVDVSSLVIPQAFNVYSGFSSSSILYFTDHIILFYHDPFNLRILPDFITIVGKQSVLILTDYVLLFINLIVLSATII
jgi:hypothetical protein